MGNQLKLRLKLLCRDKAAVICYVISFVVMLCLFLGLSNAAEERSAIPIGLIVEDDSMEAAILAEKIKDNGTFYVYEKSKEELNRLLIDGYINSIFVIDEDYASNLRAGIYEDIITVISAEDDKMSVALGDIIAGEMVFEISLNRAYNRYKKLSPDGLSREKFREYVISYSGRPEYNLPVDFEYIDNSDGKIKEEAITNGMIYRQMIAGMICMLIGIVAFTACNGLCLEYEKGITRRRNNLPFSKAKALLSDFFGIVIFTIPLAMIAGLALGGIKGMLITVLYLIEILAICFILAVTVKRLSAYQIAGIVIVIGLGVAGFISAFSGFVGTGEFLKFTPNGLYIDWFISL